MRLLVSTLTLALIAKIAFCENEADHECEHIDHFDTAGYRMAFRHTSYEINIANFFNLYKDGFVEASIRRNCDSQFRDHNLHFFWGETNEVRLDIYDLNENRAAYVTFAIPDKTISDHPQWDSFFKWDFISNAMSQHYTDIRTAPRYINLDFKGLEMHRNLYMAKTHGGCENDHIWFSVLNNKGVCWWDSIYGKPSYGFETTTIVYSPLKTAAHTLSSMSVASKFELRLGGNFEINPQNGYQKVFRYPNAAGVDFMDYYEAGVTDSFADRYTDGAGQVKLEDMFRSSNFVSDISSAKKLLVVVYDTRGNVAEALTFQGNNHFNHWFSRTNLISSLKWKLQEDDFNFFAIAGDSLFGRRFFINKLYSGCSMDAGYLVVTCLSVDENHVSCPWEDFSGGIKQNRDRLCTIFYTPGDEAAVWNDECLMGSAIEIFVK